LAVYVKEQTVSRIDQLGGGQWTLRNLTDVTVIMGRNGAGKSLLLRSWRDAQSEDVHYIAPERTGEMDFQPQYLQEELDAGRRSAYSGTNWVQEYRRRIISRIQTYFIQRGNVRGSGPLLGDPEEIEKHVASLIPDFVLQLTSGNPPYVLTRVSSNEGVTTISQLSSGEVQMLTLALDILTMAAMWEIEGKSERVLLIDEPDAHIHPDLEARFADVLIQVIERYGLQVVIATHSVSLLAALGQFGGPRTSVVYLQPRREDLPAKPFDAVLKETAACLGGHVLMGPLFGATLLLVEGDDDYRIWSQVPRHHVINLAVLPSNGKEILKYQDTLETILSSLCAEPDQPMGYALLDGDQGLPQASPHRPQKYIGYVNLECHEAENLYLTSEVLSLLGHTWEQAAQLIVERSVEHGEKAQALSEASSWDRKNVDIKDLIGAINAILDSKPVSWTVRVGTAIGRQRPSGELADFLGGPVVDALWGREGESQDRSDFAHD